MTNDAPWFEVDSLPLLLAGPVLRRTEPTAVTVWVALRQPCHLRLTVYGTAQQGTSLGPAVLVGDRPTVALGKSLHMAAVTARPVSDSGAGEGPGLERDRLYAYDLQFLGLPTMGPQDPPAHLASALGDSPEGLSYFAHGLPTLVLPPDSWQDLKLVHGSCRKPHGAGSDTLPLLDGLLAQTAADPRQRPQQIFFTGDQIYSDEVAAPFLDLVHRLGPQLLGWEEELPTGAIASTLRPGHRAQVAVSEAGLTASVGNDSGKINSHLLSLGEYLGSYLLSLSPSCWPAVLPAAPAQLRSQRRWQRQVEGLERFRRSLGRVRRALANIPVYAIFDDHDVSDDWNLNQAWCLQVLGRPLGYRVVQNSLLAYALVQAWGNTPWQFTDDRPGGQLLAAAQAWGRQGGQDSVAAAAIARHLGLPPLDPLTGLPSLHQDDQCYVLSRAADALTWHYTVESPCHQVVVLDTRTHRGYPVDQPPLAPPHLLAASALDRQLQPLTQPSPPPLTLVVAPTNVFSLKLIDWVHQLHLRQQKVFGSDVGDAWNLPPVALARFLAQLFRHRSQILVLSGDIHFSFMVQFAFTSYHPDLQSGQLVQLTSSSLANEEPLTRLIHTRLKQWILPEKKRYFQGWLAPDQLVETPAAGDRGLGRSPDWEGHLTWVPRQPAQRSGLAATAARSRRPRWRSWWPYRWFQEGREVVGHNNLALVHFTDHSVCQDCYWWAPWAPGEALCSRMESAIAVPAPELSTRDAAVIP